MALQVINLSAHQSVRLLSFAPYIESAHPKTGRLAKMARLDEDETIEQYLERFTDSVFPGNTGTYTNPQVRQEKGHVWKDMLSNGMYVHHNVGGTTVVDGLPDREPNIIWLTSFAVASAAQRPDVVCPDAVLDPATGHPIGAVAYLAFG